MHYLQLALLPTVIDAHSHTWLCICSFQIWSPCYFRDCNNGNRSDEAAEDAFQGTKGIAHLDAVALRMREHTIGTRTLTVSVKLIFVLATQFKENAASGPAFWPLHSGHLNAIYHESTTMRNAASCVRRGSPNFEVSTSSSINTGIHAKSRHYDHTLPIRAMQPISDLATEVRQPEHQQ